MAKPINLDQLERVRDICLTLPETTEKEAWGAPTFRIRNKLFAMFADNHHKDGRIALWCHAPEGIQAVLIGADPEKFFKPPYVGVKGWIGIALDKVADLELEGLVRQAYGMVAPKKLKALVDQDMGLS